MKTAKDDPTLMAIIAIILAVAALWAMGCGGGNFNSAPPPTEDPSGGHRYDYVY